MWKVSKMQVRQVTSCDYNFLLFPYQNGRKKCKKCVCTTMTLIAATSRIPMGLPEAIHIRGPCYAFPEVLHLLHPWSILALGGRCLFHTWAWTSHLLRNSLFFQQCNNFQFLNSSRMELCLVASWWMGVFLFF